MEAQRLRRLLQLLVFLPRTPIFNQLSLAVDFGVEPRTIRRDAAILVRAGLATCRAGALWLEPHQAHAIDRMVLDHAPGSSLSRDAFPGRAQWLA